MMCEVKKKKKQRKKTVIIKKNGCLTIDFRPETGKVFICKITSWWSICWWLHKQDKLEKDKYNYLIYYCADIENLDINIDIDRLLDFTT